MPSLAAAIPGHAYNIHMLSRVSMQALDAEGTGPFPCSNQSACSCTAWATAVLGLSVIAHVAKARPDHKLNHTISWLLVYTSCQQNKLNTHHTATKLNMSQTLRMRVEDPPSGTYMYRTNH